MSLDDLTRARLLKETNNLKVSPAELLRLTIDDIEKGVITPDGLLILYTHRPVEGDWDYGTYRCGLTSDQEIVTLVMAQERIIRTWRGK